ncbi:MAG: type IX secretion system PorP/SprF family membrane protein [Psychromonas sp.]|jgi:type IX secretion system PorP/SprF family membrane protein
MKNFLTVLCLMSTIVTFGQQQPFYSLWYGSPAIMNSGATSAMKEDARLFVNSRAQWLGSLPAPLLTSSFSVEGKLFKEKMSNGWIGTGLQVSNDNVGTTTINNFSAHVPINYVMELGKNSHFSFGFKPGILNTGVDRDIQTFDNQWNGIAFDQTFVTGEPVPNKFTRFDMGAGVYYSTEFFNENRIDLGFAVNNLNRPNVTQYVITEQLYRQYLLHARGTFGFSRYKFKLTPQTVAFFQGETKYLMAGMSLDYPLKESSSRTAFISEKWLKIGLHYRNDQTLIASLNLNLGNLGIGFAYDSPLGTVRNQIGSTGAFELFLRYSIIKGSRARRIR